MRGRMATVFIAAVWAGVFAAASAASASGSTETCDAATTVECVVVSASSENAFTDQTAGKAVDGIIDGYPGDHTAEWATIGGLAGSTLTLEWPSAREIGTVVLHDRPNADDDITAATLAFSDGTTVMVPPLPEDGEPLELEFPSRTTHSLGVTIDAVSPGTYNIGLAEIEPRPARSIAAMLGTPRALAGADSVLQVRPSSAATIEMVDDVRVLIVQLEVESLAGTAAVAASDFSIVDGQGTRYEAAEREADGDVPALGERELEAGERAVGAVVFEVPLRASGLLIAYTPEGDAEAFAPWTLSAP